MLAHFAYPLDMSCVLRAVRLALHPEVMISWSAHICWYKLVGADYNLNARTASLNARSDASSGALP